MFFWATRNWKNNPCKISQDPFFKRRRSHKTLSFSLSSSLSLYIYKNLKSIELGVERGWALLSLFFKFFEESFTVSSHLSSTLLQPFYIFTRETRKRQNEDKKTKPFDVLDEPEGKTNTFFFFFSRPIHTCDFSFIFSSCCCLVKPKCSLIPRHLRAM